ncbi:MAG: ubiquinone biosynthesis regulatory protein kinase UbiB [Gammaproteobacteria bacterium]|nr:ubiquinone biosynthesis regulatory protein kinase UbiB [Gammaproteobacteria bacterium]
MIPFSQFGRLLRIAGVFVRHDLDEFVLHLHLFRPYRLALRVVSLRGFGSSSKPRAERLREALEELGPVFIKFGQMLSTRPDLLPEDIASELAKLQDRVPPFPGADAQRIVEAALAAPLAQSYLHFDLVPVASASVAQVHLATLTDGTEVAVKVLRPGIEKVIARDVALLETLAGLAERWWPESQRFKPREVVEEYRKTIDNELDLMREASNASRLRANFENSPLLHVPKIYWDLTRTPVMTMERIGGIPIGNVAALREAGIDMRKLAHNGVEIFFTQAFRDGFFHADMHPGNIFVSRDGCYQAVDFGIMGTLSEHDKHYLAENFLAFFNRDYRAVAEAHVRAGWVKRSIRIEEFEAAIRAVCEPIFARPIKDISFGRLLLRLFQTARRFDMEVQPQLVLLQKTLFNIEGLGRQLYPDLDLWETAKPYLENWMRTQFGPQAFFKTLRREMPRWWSMLPESPAAAFDFLRKAANGELSIHWRSEELEKLRAEMRQHHRRLVLAVTGGSLFVAGAILFVAGAGSGTVAMAAGVLSAVGAALLIVNLAGR